MNDLVATPLTKGLFKRAIAESGSLTGENENEGTSHYNSLQAKYGRNFSGGLYMEANYTLSHLTTDAASTTQSGSAGYGAVGQAKWAAWRRKEHLESACEENLDDQITLPLFRPAGA